MMHTVKFTTVERWTQGHFNPHRNIVVTWRRWPYELESGHGTSDAVSVFREFELVHVLTVNRGLPYVGLAVYQLERSDKPLVALRELFGQEHQVDELLGPRGVDLATRTIRYRLAEWMRGFPE